MRAGFSIRGYGFAIPLIALIFGNPLSGRTFTNSEGKSLEGEIVEVAGDQVVIDRRVDHRRLTFSISKLSIGDQAYLAAWKAENPVIKIAFEVAKEADNRKSDNAGFSKSRSRDACFRIVVRNQLKEPTPPLVIHYLQFKKFGGSLVTVVADERRDKSGRRNFTSTIDLPSIAPEKPETVRTFTMNEIDKSTVSQDIKDFTSESKESLAGLCLVVHHNGREVAKWRSPGFEKQMGLLQSQFQKPNQSPSGPLVPNRLPPTPQPR